jgi:hypothetical protein
MSWRLCWPFVLMVGLFACGDDCKGPIAYQRSDVFLIGHSVAVAEAARFLEADGLAPRIGAPTGSSSVVLFAVSGLDGPMPTNVPIESVPARAATGTAILLVYSALVGDQDTREIVFMEMVSMLQFRGQPEAGQFIQVLDDAEGFEMLERL